MCVAAPNREKSLKTLFWGFNGVQGRWSWCQSKGHMGLSIND